MGQFFIRGGGKLSGEICVGGSKNAALPIIFSCILIYGKSTLTNVPDITDVEIALDILRDFGALTERVGDKVTIDTTKLVYKTPNEAKVSKLRASSYLIGASLSRFGRAELQRFGGCNFDNRPIDMHIYAATALGAKICGNLLTADRLYGGDIVFDKISVGATVNAILLASAAEGVSRIYGYAREPHIMSLIEFLNRAGAKIELFEDFILVRGERLTSSFSNIIGDMIEAGTYLALSLATESELKVSGVNPKELQSFTDACVACGAVAELYDNSMSFSGRITEPMHIRTAPYPAFPTDLQPEIAPLMACSAGGSIFEGVWKNRFGYLAELSKFGISSESKDGCAIIRKSDIYPARANATDLRCGAALLIAALCADGESVIDGSEIIKRGYSDIVSKLRKIGADIKEF